MPDRIVIFPPVEPVVWMMNKRSSTRWYADPTMADLDLEQIGLLMWAAYGKSTLIGGRRTVPSAGSIYPLTIYLLWQGKLFWYVTAAHHLVEFKDDKLLQGGLQVACVNQKSVGRAAVIIVVAANYDKIKRKYKGRGERYAILEAGHVGQNVHLMCEALGLGCVMIGAFSDRKVKAVLGIDEDPLYVIPVGRV